MKRWYLYILILVIVFLFVGLHLYKTDAVVKEITAYTEKVEEEYRVRNWQGVKEHLKEIEDVWKRHRIWACSTISTKEIDEIEISLRQSMEYARLEADVDFAGEFSMFRLCIEHIPMQEGISLYELL